MGFFSEVEYWVFTTFWTPTLIMALPWSGNLPHELVPGAEFNPSKSEELLIFARPKDGSVQLSLNQSFGMISTSIPLPIIPQTKKVFKNIEHTVIY